jgi:hypothetical protein
VPPWRTTWDSPATFLHSLGETLAAPLVGQTPPATLTWPWALIGALLLFGLALLVTLHTSYQTAATGTKRIQVHAAIVIIYVFAPTAILYAATLLGAPIYHVRYLSLFAPLFLLVPALLLVVAWRHAHWLGAAMWVGLLAASALSLVAFWTDPLYRSDDHRQAVAELAQNWRPGDSILANAGWIYPVLSIYWPEQPIGGSGSAPPQLQPSTRLLDYAQNSAPESPILPRIIRSGSVDGPPSLGWGSLNADFFAISASDTRNTLAAIADSSQRIWHYRMYDTVSDPAGVIRTWLADNSAILLDNTIPGRDFGRVQLFGAEPLTRTLSAGQPAATFGGALALLDVTIPSTVTAGSYLYPHPALAGAALAFDLASRPQRKLAAV